jgi:quinolinate synthase
MKKLRPDVELIQAPVEDKSCACNNCPYMKLNTVEKIKMALKNLKPEVQLEESVRQRAQISLERMMAISRNEVVTWPDRFTL